MIFSWLKRRRRRKLLAEPFPAEWLTYLHRNVAHYRFLSEVEQARLRDDLRVFIAEKRWEGCGGLRITDEIKVTIAAQACLLVLGLAPDIFKRVPAILVYPHGYLGPRREDGLTGLVFDEPRSGEAWYRGPVVLSWQDVLEEGREPGWGTNLVLHEFAHQLDMLNGAVDGTPLLESPQQYREWREVMTAEYERLLKAAERGRATLLDEYGTKDEGEFFAVATECFFDQPLELRRRHPRLYDLLRDYYHQDPAARCVAREGQAASE
jgi:Mlc titration factor MtfA (ptsG expression regulator)